MRKEAIKKKAAKTSTRILANRLPIFSSTFHEISAKEYLFFWIGIFEAISTGIELEVYRLYLGNRINNESSIHRRTLSRKNYKKTHKIFHHLVKEVLSIVLSYRK